MVELNEVVKVRGMVGMDKFILWLFYENSSFFHFNEDTLNVYSVKKQKNDVVSLTQLLTHAK